MSIEDLIGYYTYRSFLDSPGPVDDFNKIKFAEAELLLHINDDGAVTGSLSFPAAPGAPEKNLMDLSGRVTSWTPLRLHFLGQGRPNTSISDYEYEYDCGATHTWDSAAPVQRVVLTGTVRRNKDHGTARAGATASFVAVQRSFVEARDVPEVALIPEAIAMLASRVHRLRHTVWHTVRSDWYRRDNKMTDADRNYLRSLGWGLDDPPFTPTFQLDLSNGAGEDFLFMHRRMIAMLHQVYHDAGKAPPIGWATIPGPVTPHFAYKEVPDPDNPGKVVFQYDPGQSGFFVPPVNSEYFAAMEGVDAGLGASMRFLKTNRFFTSIMRNIERNLTNPRILAQLTLGAYGNLIEFTVHNWMHLRWTSLPRNPVTGHAGPRGDYDVDALWDAPAYDYLFDFHSSHVNPIFWRLHGWVDDRIEAWFQVQESARPGAVKRRTLKGLPWFEKGPWVLKESPFDWPEIHGNGHGIGHGSGHGDAQEVEVLLKVMERLREVDSREVPLSLHAEARGAARPRGGFARDLDIDALL